MTNPTWDEAKVNRADTGRFSEKAGLPSGITLSSPPPSREESYAEDTIDELFTQVEWHTDGSFTAQFDGETYDVLPRPDGVQVSDSEGYLVDQNNPVQQVANIAIGRFNDENPLPPAPVEVSKDGNETFIGGLYGGWERADVIANRVTNRLEEAVQAGELPRYHYQVVPTGVGTVNQHVNVFIQTGEDGWSDELEKAHDGALRIVDAWNLRQKAGLWAPKQQTYGSAVRATGFRIG